MKRLANFILAAVLSFAAVLTMLEPAAAMPMPIASNTAGTANSSDIVQVRYDDYHHRHYWRHSRRDYYRHHRHHWPRHHWRHHRWHHRHHWRHHHRYYYHRGFYRA
jgi:hypothetical protein